MKIKLKSLLKSIFYKLKIYVFNFPKKVKSFYFNFIPNTKKFIIVSKKWVLKIGSFLILLTSYLLMKTIYKLMSFSFVPYKFKSKILPFFEKNYFKIVKVNNNRAGTINRINLIEIALKNMVAKKSRTIITVGGMSIGIATIVFLVSLGYGLQDLVTSRVARLEEMRQAEVTTQAGSNLKLTDSTLESFREFQEVDSLLPMVALVAKVNYKNSVTDTAVFGVTTDYLRMSAIKPSRGKIFDSNEISYNMDKSTTGEVAGDYTLNVKVGQKIRDITYGIAMGEWVELRQNPSDESKLLGYTRRIEGQNIGSEVWGYSYGNKALNSVTYSGLVVNKWVYTKVPVWQLNNNQYIKVDNQYGSQEQQIGYMKEDLLKINDFTVLESQVLGISDTAEESTSSDTESKILQEEDGWVSIEGLTQGTIEESVTTVPLGDKAKYESVVNKSFLKILGIDENDAIGLKFQVSYVVPDSLVDAQGEKIQSTPADYEIVAVIPSEDAAYFYVPLIDVKTLGVTNYSQVKMVVKDQNLLTSARKKVETMGYVTTSVVDTVAQIDSLFSVLRKVLSLVGAVALSVAALGMFNTLTVSLLERIREIGLMKAMGMKSDEVEELFLTESMVMGFFGGVVGLLLGFIAGKLLGLIISSVAVFKGVGIIDISYIPPLFVLLILFLSLLVGLLTGIYPSRRAKGISALNALRYE